MSSSKAVLGVGIFCILFIGLSLSITSTVLGAMRPGNCDTTDDMGLNVGDYLLGSGIFGIVYCVLLALFYSMVILDIAVVGATVGITFISILGALYGLAWFIVGAIILYRGNIECIKEGSIHVIYALVMWCISAFNLVMNCINIRVNSKDR